MNMRLIMRRRRTKLFLITGALTLMVVAIGYALDLFGKVIWVRVPHDPAVFGGAGDVRINDVMIQDNLLVAFGGEADPNRPVVRPVVWRSADGGSTWTRAWEGTGSDGAAMERGVRVLNGSYVVVGSGALWHSADGVSWTPISKFSSQPDATAMAWGITTRTDGLLIAVGSSGMSARSWFSTDGTVWIDGPLGCGGSEYNGNDQCRMVAAHTRFGQYGGQYAPRYVAVGWRTYESSSSFPNPYITGNREYQPVVWTSHDGFNWANQILVGYDGWYGHELYLVSEKEPARYQGDGGNEVAWGLWAYGVRSPVAIHNPGVLKIFRSVYGDGWSQADAPGQDISWETEPWATQLYAEGVHIFDYQKRAGGYDMAVGSFGAYAQTFSLQKSTDDWYFNTRDPALMSSIEQEMRGIGCCVGAEGSQGLGLIAVGWSREVAGEPTVGAVWRRVGFVSWGWAHIVSEWTRLWERLPEWWIHTP